MAMRYKGWGILARIEVPHYYEIKDVHSPYSVVRFGPEVQTDFSKQPNRYSGTRSFYAYKDGHEPITGRSFGGIKTQIDKIEEERV